jgi:probable F420-dependent oxidoreductase
MKFGISVGDAPYTKSLAMLRAAERADFDQVWVWDSHIIWQETYSLMGWLIGMSADSRLEWGTCVTNPVTRDPVVVASAFATLNQITGGRVICGIGRGDSSVRLVKRRPSNLAALERAVDIIHEAPTGEPFEVDDGVEARMPWTSGRTRVYIAGYGPRVLRLAGRIADGIIFQIGDPAAIEWMMRSVRMGAEEAGRDPAELTIHCSCATYISDDMAEARDQTRWFPAEIGNHFADMLRHHDPGDVPQDLVQYVAARGEYDYREHAERGTEHSKYVPDEIVDRFCVIGNGEQVSAKLRELERIGVSEFNIYPLVDDNEALIERYARDVLPALRAGTAARSELA